MTFAKRMIAGWIQCLLGKIWCQAPLRVETLNPVPSFQVVSTSPPIHQVSQAVEKSEEDDLKMAAFPKALDGQTCPGQLDKLLVHGQRFQLEIQQRMRSVGLQILSSNPDQT